MNHNNEDDFMELGNTGLVPLREGLMDLSTGEVIEYDAEEEPRDEKEDTQTTK